MNGSWRSRVRPAGARGRVRLPAVRGGPARRPAGLQRSPAEGITPSRRGRRSGPPRRRRRTAVLLAVLALFMLSPVAPAAADPFGSDPCRPADNPSPEMYGSGLDGMIKPPGYPSEELKRTPPEELTYYDRYGSAGQHWYAVDMGCADAMAMMGNALANTTFTLARVIDRTTITVYQAAASESLLGWLKNTVDDVISGMGETFNARYWSWVVILGAIWLAWWGLVRKRASRVTEGTIWMVAAMVALIWLVARPADFTTLGTKVSEATSAAFNAALPQADNKGAVCIPSPNGENPAASPDVDATTRNANGLWVALVCKPWLMGEFGTTDPNAKIVKDNADRLLWSQAVDLSEAHGQSQLDLSKKADAYKQVAENIKEEHPGVYPLFQGKNWTARFAVALGALFAACVAGLLVLVVAIALIVVKIAFLLLLVAGPIFLGIGIHPGIGRVIAMRWLELLLSMLLKQAALIGVLALLLWTYGLILSEGLPWGLQVMLISLVTIAAFIYRKPFQHLFSAVGYSAVGARDKGEVHLDKSIAEARKSTVGAATAVVPGAAGYRLARWAKRDPAAEGTALGDAAAGTTAAADRRGALATADAANGDAAGAVVAGKSRGGGTAAAAGRPRTSAPPLNLSTRGRSSAGTGRSGGLATAADTGDSGGSDRAASGGGTGRPTSWVGARAGRGSGGEGGGEAGGVVGAGVGGRSSGGGSRPRGEGAGASGGGRISGGTRPSGGGRGTGGDSRAGRRSGGSSGRGSGGGSGRGGLGGGSRDSGGSAGSGTARRNGRPSDPAAGVPRPRSGGDGGASGGDRRTPPPLWGSTPRDEGPPMPFWLRPAEGASERED
ncbi:type IV secretion system protein [Thermomonospora cellulosilytica]|uniref:Putative membrane protein n=1 Tax=Thermomonospora cellulosilytica TaxID=1411118 RepID=A0A7W3MXN3_9ACTN|nr:type IV secretion system protein [Thermomonospora cellulosilytica]MBA9003790.1 putative membrane protein [Thermomonospora cellulosilytica]